MMAPGGITFTSGIAAYRLAQEGCWPPCCPGGRIGHPEDIANDVSYLMSDNLVTGTVLHAGCAQLLV